MRVRGVLPAIVGGVLAATVVLAGSDPVAVSPGDASETVLVKDICPTFSWGGVEGASSYELALYRLGGEGEAAERVYGRRIPGAALSWTPSLDRCLEWGQRYAWSVRAHTANGATAWAEPGLFRVPPSAATGRCRKVPSGIAETRGSRRVTSWPARTPPLGLGPGSASAREPRAVVEEPSPTSLRYGLRAVLDDAPGRSIAIEGSNAGGAVHSAGVAGRSDATVHEETYGVTGSCSANVACIGVYGSNSSGHGVWGDGLVGVLGTSGSAVGHGGIFLNSAGGDLIAAEGASLLSDPDFRVDNDGNVVAASFTGIGSGLVDLTLTIIRRSDESIVNSLTFESPACAAGELLTGGGCHCSGADLKASRSWPTTGSPDRWHCRCSSMVTITAEAICLQWPQSP